MTDADSSRILWVGPETDDTVASLASDGRFSVHRASDIETALTTLSETAIDCVVCRNTLPESDGIALFERVRDRGLAVPFVLFPRDGSEQLASDALSAGVTEYLPCRAGTDQFDELVETITAAVEDCRDEQRAQSRQLQALLENASERVSILDRAGKYTFVSPAFENLLGYDPGELVGDSGFEYVHPADRERVVEEFERLAAAPEETVTVEYRIRHADGSWRWVESRGTNRLDSPAIEGIVVNSREITERRQREERLREEQAFTDSVLSALPDVLYVFDEHGQFLRWNDQLTEVTGYSDEEIESISPTELIAPEDRAAVTEAITDVFREGTTVTVEADFLTKDGDRIPYEFTGSQLTGDGDRQGLVGIGRDISTRKERQRRFEAVFNNTYQFTGLMRPDGTVLEANDAALSFGGIDREEVVGEQLWNTYWFRRVEDTRQTARDAVERARSGEMFRTQLTVQGIDRTAEIDFSVRPMTDSRGEVTLLVVEGRDITTLKERERHLEVLHRFLRHNLRNELTIIEGFASLLADKADSPEHADYAERILDSTNELLEMSETVKNLSDVVLDTDSTQHPVDVVRELDAVLDDVRERYPGADVALSASGRPEVSADWRLQTVFEELVENAIEHTDADTPEVELSVNPEQDYVAVEVADNGPGIADVELTEILDADDRSQLEHGSGIGLWLVNSLVENYGGQLSYASPADRGSVITVRLPKTDNPPLTGEESKGRS